MNEPNSPLFAGREAELAALRRLAEDAACGATRIAFIEAGAGLGKTRLVRELLAGLEPGRIRLSGSCLPLNDSGLPYGPFAEILRQAAADLGADTLAALAGPIHARRLATVLPGFGGLDGDPDSGRADVFEAVVALLAGLGRRQPLVLVLEDLHWAHATTTDLLAFVLRALPPGTLAAATYRDADARARPELWRALGEMMRHPGATTLRLAPLTQREVGVQLEGLLGRPADPGLLQAVHARAGGVPLFTEALVAPDGDLRDRLAPTARSVVLAPLVDLPPGAAEALRAAAVIGSEVDARLLATVLQRGVEDVEGDLRRAISAGMLASAGQHVAFRHELIREELEAEALPTERARLHARAAAALEAWPETTTFAWRAAQVARHWRLGGDPARALRWAWTAASEAAAAFAYPEQLRLLEDMLALERAAPGAAEALGLNLVDVRTLATDAACWAGETEAGLRHVEAALAAADAAPDGRAETAALLLQRAALREQALLGGQVADLERALELAVAPDALRAEGLAQLCRVLTQAGRAAEAAPRIEELRRLAASLPTEEFAIEAEIVAGGGCVARLDAARRRARQTGFGRLEVLATLALVDAHLAAGADGEAAAAARQGLARAAELGQARYRGVLIAARLAAALARQGDWDTAETVIDDGLALDPTPLGRSGLLLWRAQIAAWRGDADAGDLPTLPDHGEIELALRRHGRRLGLTTRPDRKGSAPHGLTAREVEVLRMVAGGHSNAEIATALAIAPKTASVHVSNILGKLGVASRSAAAAVAWRLQLAS